MKTLFTILIASLALVEAAFGRLGETRAQIQARFGEPVREVGSIGAGGIVIYKKSDVIITVTYVEGRAEGIEYENAAGFSNDELQILAHANRQGGRWKLSARLSGLTIYNCSSGARLTAWLSGKAVVRLEFASRVAIEEIDKRLARRDRERRRSAEDRLSSF